MNRRHFLTTAVAGSVVASVGVPVYLRRAWAQGPIKIGMPAALSGSYAQYGIQARRAAELFSKDIKAKGILGRPVEFIYEDTAGDPATAVRKAQKLVEKDGVKFLTGVALSSEALAVSAKCPEWKVIFMSTINGAGSLTTKSFHRYFFRVNLRYRKDVIGFAQFMNRCVTHWHFYRFTRDASEGKLRLFNSG